MKPRLVTVSDRIREETPRGIERHAALHTSTMWARVAVNAAHLGTPWHHHGEHEAAIYVTRDGSSSSRGRPGPMSSKRVPATSFTYRHASSIVSGARRTIPLRSFSSARAPAR